MEKRAGYIVQCQDPVLVNGPKYQNETNLGKSQNVLHKSVCALFKDNIFNAKILKNIQDRAFI